VSSADALKITMVLTRFHPYVGGAENQAHLQGAELARRGHEVSVVTWRPSLDLPARDIIDQVTVHRVNLDERFPMAILSGARMGVRLLRSVWRADVVIAHQVNLPGHLAAWISWALRRPVIAKVAISLDMPGIEFNPSRSGSFADRFRRRGVDFLARHGTLIAMTSDIEAGLRALGARRIVRIPNGVEAPPPSDQTKFRASLLAGLNVPADAALVVAAGRLTAQKRFDVVLRAWQCSGAAGHRLLILLGTGPDLEKLRLLATDLSISSTARFLAVDAARSRQIIGAADVLVVASRYEGMSNVMLEAMAAGVPVISTPVSGAVDLIRDGINGRLVPHDDPDAMGAAIQEVLEAPGNIGAMGRSTVLDSCRMDHVVDLYERLFHNVRSVPRGVLNPLELLQMPLPVPPLSAQETQWRTKGSR